MGRKWKPSHTCLWYCYDTISVRYWKISVLKVHLVYGFVSQNPVLQFLYGWQVWKCSIPTSAFSTYQTYLCLWNKIPGFLCSPADRQENYTYLHLKSVPDHFHKSEVRHTISVFLFLYHREIYYLYPVHTGVHWIHDWWETGICYQIDWCESAYFRSDSGIPWNEPGKWSKGYDKKIELAGRKV